MVLFLLFLSFSLPLLRPLAAYTHTRCVYTQIEKHRSVRSQVEVTLHPPSGSFYSRLLAGLLSPPSSSSTSLLSSLLHSQPPIPDYSKSVTSTCTFTDDSRHCFLPWDRVSVKLLYSLPSQYKRCPWPSAIRDGEGDRKRKRESEATFDLERDE